MLYAVFAARFPLIMLSIVSIHGGPAGRGESVGFFDSVSGAGRTVGQLAAGALLGLLAPPNIFLVIDGIAVGTTTALGFSKGPTPAVPRKPDLGKILAETRRRLLPAAGEHGHLTTNGHQWLYLGLTLGSMTVLGVTIPDLRVSRPRRRRHRAGDGCVASDQSRHPDFGMQFGADVGVGEMALMTLVITAENDD